MLLALIYQIVPVLPVAALARAEGELPPQTPIESAAPVETVAASSFFGITASLAYPTFPDSSSHSALRQGDSFSVSASSYDILLRDAYLDAHELGLSDHLPLSGSLGQFSSDVLTVPGTTVDGLYTITVHSTSPLGNDVSTSIEIVIDSTAPAGTLEASFGTNTDIPAQLIAHLAGTVDGTGSTAIITGGRIFSVDSLGRILSSIDLDTHRIATLPSPFSTSIPIPPLDPSWIRIGISLDLTDEAGNTTTIQSVPFPRASATGVLIDHAQGGSRIEAPNYVPGDIPAGVGISHNLINSLPDGDYYAVVFFEGANGCPTSNYQINAFRANAYWGYGVVGPNGFFSRAWSSAGGGCMQQFHINPIRNDDWLWGALSNTGTSTAVADLNGIPAFAICATKEACDPITVSVALETPETHATSNVLFLPGIKGSLLYEENLLCLIPNDECDVRLWLPFTDAAAPRLYLDQEGKSTRDVYAREGAILANAFGASFYDSFAAAMNARAADSEGEHRWHWQPAAYDWRLSLPDITTHGRKVGSRLYFDSATSTPYLEASLRSLARESPTGKVTIVAHSNGGLVAKSLMQRLGDQETARLIDSVIFVAVPQGGAPRAVASLLFGESEAIPRSGRLEGLLLSAARARTFAINSPMAYHLLPSAAFLAKHLNPNYPLLTFGSGPLLQALRARFGVEVNSWDDFVEFALGRADTRQQPEESDLVHAAVLNQTLLTYAEQAHNLQQEWEPPAGVVVHEIGGTGVATLSGIELYEQPTRENGIASTTVSYRPLFNNEGDGTVPLTSAHDMNVSDSVQSYTIDLPAASDDTHWYSHANIFEVPEVERLVARIIDGETSSARDTLRGAGAIAMATADVTPGQLALYLHGDARITLTDTKGRQSISGAGASQEEIVGSQSGSVGNVFYVVAPLNDGYTVTIGESSDPYVTLDIEVRENDAIVSRRTIASIALEENGIAQLELHEDADISSPFMIDYDGNGSVDAQVVLENDATVFAPEPTASTLLTESNNDAEIQKEQTISSHGGAASAEVAQSSESKQPRTIASSTSENVSLTVQKEIGLLTTMSDIKGTSTQSQDGVMEMKKAEHVSVTYEHEESWWERLLRLLRDFWNRFLLWLKNF